MNDRLCSSTSTLKPCGAGHPDKASRSCQANGGGGGGAPSACLTASPAAEANSNIVPCGTHTLNRSGPRPSPTRDISAAAATASGAKITAKTDTMTSAPASPTGTEAASPDRNVILALRSPLGPGPRRGAGRRDPLQSPGPRTRRQATPHCRCRSRGRRPAHPAGAPRCRRQRMQPATAAPPCSRTAQTPVQAAGAAPVLRPRGERTRTNRRTESAFGVVVASEVAVAHQPSAAQPGRPPFDG